jgi:transcriptional antiterminator Rof (Rho-off)
MVTAVLEHQLEAKDGLVLAAEAAEAQHTSHMEFLVKMVAVQVVVQDILEHYINLHLEQ